MDVKLQDIMTS